MEKLDASIFGTGYRPNVAYLKSLPKALDSQGSPIQQNGVSTYIEGRRSVFCWVKWDLLRLRFVG